MTIIKGVYYMTMDTNFIEYISPNIAAKRLGIAATTLRKYSNLIEKISENKHYFKRDSSNSRLYTQVDISVLKRVITLKKHPDFSLEKSINLALLENSIEGISNNDTRFDQDTRVDLNTTQDSTPKQYEALISKLVESNLKLADQLEFVLEKIEYYDKKLQELEQISALKKGGFNRFFKKKSK